MVEKNNDSIKNLQENKNKKQELDKKYNDLLLKMSQAQTLQEKQSYQTKLIDLLNEYKMLSDKLDTF